MKIMRLPIKEKGKNLEPIILLNKLYLNLKEAFEDSIKNEIQYVNTKVMLADFSVIETTTFDTNKIENFFLNLEKKLKTEDEDWQIVTLQSTKSDDLRRIYFQLSIEIDKFYFYIYMGIQFHSLFYYRVDKEVIRISKKIRELEDQNQNIRGEITIKGDQLIKQELEKLGYKGIENTHLFEELFTKSEISEKLIEKASVIESNYPEVEKNIILINELQRELNDLIIEVYHINPASLDQNKMLQGEEGMVVYMDFELIKNKKTNERTSVINFDKITDDSLNAIEQAFNFVIDKMKD